MPCTIASLMPFAVDEPVKPGLCPGKFRIDPSDGQKPVLLIIKNAVRAQFNENYKVIDMPVPAEEVAQSVVNDFIIGQKLTSDAERPAIFWVDGEWTQKDFEIRFAKQIEEAKQKQITWFQKLVKEADDMWQQFHQHKFIEDLQRTAARYLNYKREWLDDSTDRIVKCPACQTLVSKEAAICFACKCVLDADKYQKFQFAGAPLAPAKV